MTAGWHAYENESCCTHTGHSFVAACSLASQPPTLCLQCTWPDPWAWCTACLKLHAQGVDQGYMHTLALVYPTLPAPKQWVAKTSA